MFLKNKILQNKSKGGIPSEGHFEAIIVAIGG